jgi:uncharacterized protein YbjT (DUF2867 family)
LAKAVQGTTVDTGNVLLCGITSLAGRADMICVVPETLLPRIAITGATGYIGGRLVPRLLDLGYGVRCLVRSPGKLQDRAWAQKCRVEIRRTELDDVESIAQNLKGCEAAFYLIHSMTSAGSDYAKRDRDLASNFARAAREAGVTRIIYLGGLGETGPDLSEHLSSRREVESALASTGVPVTVLRAAMIVGSGSASFEILRYLVERLPVMITPKWVTTPCQAIAVENVIGYLAGVLSTPETTGGVFDIGGSETLCYRDIMQVMAEEAGLRPRWVIPVPVLTPRLSSYWIHLITPLSNNIARPLAEGLKNPVVCRDDRIARLIPQKLLNVREAIHAALTQMAEHHVETNWSMAGVMPGDPDWAGGAVFRDEREAALDVPDWAAFQAVCRLGGGHGWYAADWLWKIRGWVDLLAGGPGLRRGRRDSKTVRYGDAIDFWRVTALEPNRRLALRAEMKLPGEAMLEFCIESHGGAQCTLRQAAWFKPRGLFGLIYWYLVMPFHEIVFSGMLRGIRREAAGIAAESPQVIPTPPLGQS